LIVTDDMYEHIYWDSEPFANILNVAPELYDRTFVLNGCSKTYAMTGWRIGYAAGPVDVITAMNMVQSQSTSSANSIAQKAALAALTGPQACVVEMAQAFRQRYNYLFSELSNIKGMVVPQAQGAFYLYPYVQQLIDRLGLADDYAFCNYLLDELEIAAVPGSASGTPGFIRLSFATSQAVLTEAVKRLKKVF
jgi:aspartate aminotransferase